MFRVWVQKVPAVLFKKGGASWQNLIGSSNQATLPVAGKNRSHPRRQKEFAPSGIEKGLEKKPNYKKEKTAWSEGGVRRE